MAATPIKDQKNVQTDRTWAEEFREIDTTSKAYKDLLKQLTDTVAAQNAFVQDSRKDFEEYVKGLDNISDSWSDVQKEIEKLTIQTEVYGTTAEDVQRIFTDIANSASTVAQRLTIQKAVMRNIADVAGEISRTYVVDNQFTEKSLNAHIQKLQIAKSQFEFQIKAITGGSLEEEDRKKAAEDSEKRIRSLQNRIDKQLYLNNAQKKGLEEEIRLENIKLESLSKYNEAVLEGLQKEAQFDLENRRNINSKFSGLQVESGILGKVAGAFGLGDLKSEIEGISESARQRIGILYKNKHLAEVDLDKKKGLENQSKESLTSYGKDLGISDEDLKDIVEKIQKNPNVSADSLAATVKFTAQSYGIGNDAILDKLVQSSETHRQNVLDTADSSKQLETAQKNTANATGIARDAAAQMAKHFAKSVFSARALALWIGSNLWKSFTAVDESAVKLQRAVGTWEGDVAGANAKLATSKDYLEQTYAIAKKFGVNTSAVFTPAELARAAEFKNLSNLSADQVAILAVRAKVVGKNIDEYNKGLNAGWKNIVSSTSAAVNFEAVQEEVANISAALAISLGGNPEKIAAAATAARSLGMSLKDMESVADNLLNFESSIKSEMEAQLLTGMSLNLAGARECALYNDMTGLAEQLNGQGLTFERLAGMNRVQLNSVAQALGMSKDQLAEMVQQQVLSSNMSDKQKAAMLRMSEEDFRRMTTEKQWQQTKEKFLQSLVPLMKPIVDILTMIIGVARPITALIGKAVSYIGYVIDPLQKAFSTIQEFWGKLFSGSGKNKKNIQEVGDQVQDLSVNVQKSCINPVAALLAFSAGVKGLSVAFKGTIASVKLFAKAAKAAFVAPFKVIGKLIGGINKLSAAYSALQVKISKTRAISGGSKAGATGKVLAGGFWKSVKGSAKGAFVEGKGGSKAASSVAESVSNTKTGGDVSKKLTGTSKGVKGFSGKNVLAGAAAMVLVAGSLFILAHALKALGGVGLKECGILAASLIVLAGAVVVLGKIEKDLTKGAAAVLLMSIALLPLALSLNLLKGVDWKQFAIMAASIAAFALEMTILGALLAGPQVLLFLAGAAAVGVMSVALMAFAATMAVLSKTQGIEVNTEKISEQIRGMVVVARSLAKLGVWMLPVIPAALLTITGSGVMLLALEAISTILRIASKLPVVDTTNLVAMTKGMLSITKSLGLTAAILALTAAPLLALPALVLLIYPALWSVNKVLTVANNLPEVQTDKLVKMTAGMLAVTVRLAKLGVVLLVYSTAILSTTATLLTVRAALKAVSKTLNTANELPSVDLNRVKSSISDLIEISKGLASVRPVNFAKFWGLKWSLNIISKFKDMKLASGIDQVTDALSRFSEILNRLDVEKFNKLSVRRIKAIAKVQTQQQPEGVQENYKATVQTRAVADSRKHSRVESVEKGKVDLSVIEQKLDVVVKAIESSRPNWNWLEFDKAAATGLPGWQRNR